MMLSPSSRCPLVLITDAHINEPQGNAGPFFEMLAVLAKGTGDVIFLGDIFDLWIGLPRYEDALHRRFLSWCVHQKGRRRIGFVEGNHEFFLARGHGDAFTWCTPHAWWQDAEGNFFSHGDRINRHDRRYRLFRHLTKNPFARILLQALPSGPRLAHHLKNQMKGTNAEFRKSLPLEQIRDFAERRFRAGATRVFLGHFHQAFHYCGRNGGDLYALPDWYSGGWISVLPSDRGGLRQGVWQDILPLYPDGGSLRPKTGVLQ